MLQEDYVNMCSTPLTRIWLCAIFILGTVLSNCLYWWSKRENLPGPHRLDQLMRPSQTQYCLGSTNNTRHNIYSFCNKENYNKSLRV